MEENAKGYNCMLNWLPVVSAEANNTWMQASDGEDIHSWHFECMYFGAAEFDKTHQGVEKISVSYFMQKSAICENTDPASFHSELLTLILIFDLFCLTFCALSH